MKCVICKHGETKEGLASITLEKGSSIIVFKSVPSHVCQNCGESFFDEEITKKLLEKAKMAVEQGVQVDVRKYAA